jgi:MFS family permease
MSEVKKAVPTAEPSPKTMTRSSSPEASDLEKGQVDSTFPPDSKAQPVTANNDELYNPGPVRFWLIMLCNSLALFLVALDRTIVATAIPRITDDFHSLGDIGWYASSYLLTLSAMQLIFGRIYRLYDTKIVFLASVFVFEIGSVICAAAPTSAVFIFGRAVAGAASAGVFSGFIQIVIPMVPLHKRPMFQSMFGMVFGITGVAGPLIGGAFTSNATWR